MAVDPVPWFVEGGAQHSAQMARLVTYLLMGGREGVFGALDMRVEQQSAPNGTVRARPGAGGILNRATGQDRQMYASRIISDETVTIPPTSGTARADMIVARVENPWLAGESWSAPASTEDGPYFFIRRLNNVPSGARTITDAGIANHSAIPLARINIPSSTTAITQAMITDLRRVVNPITGEGYVPGSGGAERLWTVSTDTPSDSVLTPANTTYITWPSEAVWNVPVPEWATHADIQAIFTPAMLGNVWGQARYVLNGVAGPNTHFDDNYVSPAGGGGMRTLIRVAGRATIPAGIRGATVNLHLEARQETPPAGLTTGNVVANDGTWISAQVNFLQLPVFS